jgi:glutamate synthase (ferredoxin)
MGELEMVGILFDIPHDFFKKVCDFEIQQQNNMPWEWCSCPKVPTKSLFAKPLLKHL